MLISGVADRRHAVCAVVTLRCSVTLARAGREPLSTPHLARVLRHPTSGGKSGLKSVRSGPDSRRLLSGSDDGTCREWDVVTGEALRVLTAPEAAGTATYTGYGCGALTDSDGRGAETGMALDPTGRLPALRDGSRTRLRSLDTGGQVHELRHPGDVWWPFFSLAVTMLAVGTAADQAYVWELA